MGQQQLLLVILVTIIVGIATVVAINVFGSSAESANRDAVRQDVLTIAAAAQGWYIKPDMMGGGGNSFDGMKFTDINFSAEAIHTDGEDAFNMNGAYNIDTSAGNTFAVTAYPASDPNFDSADSFNQTGVDVMTATVCKDGIAWGSGGAFPADCN